VSAYGSVINSNNVSVVSGISITDVPLSVVNSTVGVSGSDIVVNVIGTDEIKISVINSAVAETENSIRTSEAILSKVVQTKRCYY
jgi:hypothetical protein